MSPAARKSKSLSWRLKVQSTPPAPVPVESCRVVESAEARSSAVSPGTPPPVDQTAEFTETLTEWVSDRSTSVKFSVPVGSGVVVSSAVDPVVFACSVSEADSGPLVMVGASLAPVISTETVWLSLVEASLTLTL